MDISKKQSRLYSFYKTVIAAIAFAACFYLLIVCFAGTYRLISDIGSVRVLFLNPILILLIAVCAVIFSGIGILKTKKYSDAFEKLEDKQLFDRAMQILKIVIFAECLLFTVGASGMGQREDQLEVQQSAYGFSWRETETFTAPGYLGIYPNNLGISVVLYLLSFVTGHYNNLFIMLIYSILVPFIYSDLAYVGEKFGLSKKSQFLIMICGAVFLPLQAKSMIIYGDVPGLFLSVRAMKTASDIAVQKSSPKKAIAASLFMGLACILKNNFIIFAIAITIYLAAELLRQRRFKELYIPVAVMASAVLLNMLLGLIVSLIAGKAISSGASKWSWIAMGMQEEAGLYNGYNALTYAQSDFDSAVQSVQSKNSIAQSMKDFMAEPNYAIGFYARKIMVQWSDPTHCAFEFHSRNACLDESASPLMWFLASPRVISVASSFLKVFQLLMFAGSAAFAVKTGRRKNGSPALLLFLTFVGGYVFHIIWEAAPFYTLSYMVLLIPTGVAGLVSMLKKLSGIKIKELSKIQISPDSGIIYFIIGALVFLIAAAGLGTVRIQLAEGRSEYKTYYKQTLDMSRNPVPEGTYLLKPAGEGFEGEGLKVELIKYAGRYRMRYVTDNSDDVFVSFKDGRFNIDWFSYDETQVFTILRNGNGTYSICCGKDRAVSFDQSDGSVKLDEFVDYTFDFNSEYYDGFIAEHPNMTWNFVPVS